MIDFAEDRSICLIVDFNDLGRVLLHYELYFDIGGLSITCRPSSPSEYYYLHLKRTDCSSQASPVHPQPMLTLQAHPSASTSQSAAFSLLTLVYCSTAHE